MKKFLWYRLNKLIEDSLKEKQEEFWMKFMRERYLCLFFFLTKKSKEISEGVIIALSY